MSHDQETTNLQRYKINSSYHALCGMKLKDWIQIISSLLLPLALGLFTVIITFEQQKSTQKQRDEDRYAAQLQREQDKAASDLQRELERNLTEQRYRDDVLDTYIRDMATLLKDGNGSLAKDKVIATVATLKTINIFRQLDPERNTRVIRFLYETKALTQTDESSPLDLATTELISIDFRNLTRSQTIDSLSLSDIFLTHMIASGIQIQTTHFIRTAFDGAHWDHAQIYNSNFSSSTFDNSDLSYTKMERIDLSDVKFVNINFTHSSFIESKFEQNIMENIDLSHSLLRNVKFTSATLTHVNFSHSNLKTSTFFMVHVSNIDFRQANCIGARFFGANLSHSSFNHVDAKRVSFTNSYLSHVNFTGANLYMTSFINTDVTDEQLSSAISIENVILRNGTVLHDPNLIRNGEASCNKSLSDDWDLQNGSIITMIDEKNNLNCYFTLEPIKSVASMKQMINISKVLNFHLWPNSHVTLSARMSLGVSVELRSITGAGSIQKTRQLRYSGGAITLELLSGIETLEVVINLSVDDQNYNLTSWCDDVTLVIVFGFEREISHRLDAISSNANWSTQSTTILSISTTFNSLTGLTIDRDTETIFLADFGNRSIISWKLGRTMPHYMYQGVRSRDILIDKKTNSILIGNQEKRRVERWSLDSVTATGETIIENITCYGLAMDDEDSVYVSDPKNHEVRRYLKDDRVGTVVAGGHGQGKELNQLNEPRYLAINSQGSVYVSDYKNHRVVKWDRGAKQGVLVAGFGGSGSKRTQLFYPTKILVDADDNIYIADTMNDRVVRYRWNAKVADILISHVQLKIPLAISFDRHGNLYVSDSSSCVRRFLLIN